MRETSLIGGSMMLILLPCLTISGSAGTMSDIGFYIVKNTAFQTHPTAHGHSQSLGLLGPLTAELCQKFCAVRSNCDFYVHFGGNQTCHHLQTRATRKFHSGVKILAPKTMGFVDFASHAPLHLIGFRNTLTIPTVPSSSECEDLCRFQPNCEAYHTAEDVCILNEFLESSNMLPVIGFKLTGKLL
ncbi:hypothetical protein BV898_08398 [Hypsibius exemplaris]|uniref:Apple domain-containing protein n=1 Tax=Hypsibius exemplaris TaxID=2072580 RepID=A0A1W0WQI7_HYPEX|nr:hypothetical protein BV898_08398 [Hypsibius exemplaris]